MPSKKGNLRMLDDFIVFPKQPRRRALPRPRRPLSVILLEIVLEPLRFFDRAALERLQMHSRYLRDLVKRHTHSLPLRYVHHVEIKFGDVYIRLLQVSEAIEVKVPGEQDLELLFHRVHNVFVERLTLSFIRADLPLPYYLRSKANDLNCHVGTLNIKHAAVGIDYALVDFLGVCLKPQTYEPSTMGTSPLRKSCIMLFTRSDALRRNLSHLVLNLNGPPPDYIVPELFGVNVVETCAMTTHVDPRPWIANFIETFKVAERGTDVVRSVTLLCGPNYQPGSHAVGLLEEPRRTDVQTPHNAFVEAYFRRDRRTYERSRHMHQYTMQPYITQHGTVRSYDLYDCPHLGVTRTTESPVAELFVFENTKAAKKLEIFVWTIEQVEVDVEWDFHLDARVEVPTGDSSSYCAFVLKFVDM